MFYSLSPNPRSDLFEFNFPELFWDKTITDKYNKYLNIEPQVLTDIQSLVNESVQGFVSPAFGFQPIQQEVIRNGYQSSPQYYRPNTSEENLMDKVFTVSVKHCDAYLTYFVLLEHFFKYFNSGAKKDINLGTWPVRTLTSDNEVVCTVLYQSVLFIGLSALQLNYADNLSTFQTFELTFAYSTFDTSFKLPDVTDKFESQ